MKKFLEFFSESDGQLSNQRLLAFLAVASFIIDWQKHIWGNLEFNPSVTVITFVLVTVGFKVAQKWIETTPEQK